MGGNIQVGGSMDLTKAAQKVLSVLLQRSALSGGELASITELSGTELFEAAQELLRARVISANEPAFGPSQIFRVYFNLNPSARSFGELAVR